MKLLLRKDVPKLGQVGDMVDVSAGYARNYLLPQGLAVEPSPANLRAIEEDKKRAAADRMRRLEQLQQQAERLRTAEVTIEAAANEEGHLYGSVTAKDIAEALQADGHSVEARQVKLEHPIRQLDTVAVPVELAEGVATEVKVWVVREKMAGEPPENEASGGQQRPQEQ